MSGETRAVLGGSEKSLLIDDEESLLRLGHQALSKVGYLVLTAADGREAVEVYRRLCGEIDLVVLDLMMPLMGGKECMKALLEINPSAKVVISTGYPVDGPNLDDLTPLIRGLVEKPYTVERLLDVVRAALDAD